MADGLQRTVLSRATVTTDKEIHVSLVVAPNGDLYVEIREFIPSLDQYSRGVTTPATQEIIDSLLNGLTSVEADVLESV